MICQRCKQNQATVHFKQSINGKNSEMYLCPTCYHQLHGGDGFGWTTLFGEPSRPQVLQCNHCGITYDHFLNGEKFGCAHCYEVFDDNLEQILKRLHGSSVHQGRLPGDMAHEERKKAAESEGAAVKQETPEDKKKAAAEKRLEKAKAKVIDLKQQMNAAVKEENYELAASLRDEIKKLEKKLEGGEKK